MAQAGGPASRPRGAGMACAPGAGACWRGRQCACAGLRAGHGASPPPCPVWADCHFEVALPGPQLPTQARGALGAGPPQQHGPMAAPTTSCGRAAVRAAKTVPLSAIPWPLEPFNFLPARPRSSHALPAIQVPAINSVCVCACVVCEVPPTLERPVMRSFFRSQYSIPGKARNMRARASSPTLCSAGGPNRCGRVGNAARGKSPAGAAAPAPGSAPNGPCGRRQQQQQGFRLLAPQFPMAHSRGSRAAPCELPRTTASC